MSGDVDWIDDRLGSVKLGEDDRFDSTTDLIDHDAEADIDDGPLEAFDYDRDPKAAHEETKEANPFADPVDELENFRSQWRAELQAKKGGVNIGPVRWKEDGIRITVESKRAEKSPVTVKQPQKVESVQESGNSVSASGIVIQADEIPQNGESSMLGQKRFERVILDRRSTARQGKEERDETAVDVYTRAVESEQSGQLNDALSLYRRAFKLNDSVDRLYARSLLKKKEEVDEDAPNPLDVVSSAVPVDEPYSFQRHIQTAPDYESNLTGPTPQRISPLTKLLNTHSQSLTEEDETMEFLAAEEKLPIPIRTLPPELLENVLGHLDVASIERFALTCWKARYLTAKSEVWKKLVTSIYRPPGNVSHTFARKLKGNVGNELVRRHGGEWRTVLLEEERIRMDGCYIAVCHYVRPGAGDEWVAVTHMITYHRFLRFYPDGSVISFLTTDHPSEVVPILRPSLRAKGIHFGQWRLVRSDRSSPEDETNLPKPVGGNNKSNKSVDGKERAKIIISGLLDPSREPKYEFEMDLSLRETGRGRWNKLDLQAYRSINLSDGEVLGLALKHQRPFYFSKVKSYHPAF